MIFLYRSSSSSTILLSNTDSYRFNYGQSKILYIETLEIFPTIAAVINFSLSGIAINVFLLPVFWQLTFTHKKKNNSHNANNRQLYL